MKKSETFMKIALTESLKGSGFVSPNPRVGCVIVKNGLIVGQGAHLKYGEAHAEINALNSLTTSPLNAELFVTLEPCSHYGKTPPCVEAIIKAKIKKVYIGTLDPNPLVAGRGVKLLQDAKIEVEVGILEKECLQINEAFFYFITKKLPFVVFKSATSLDGCISTNSGHSQWISCKESRVLVHKLRSELDAVMIGYNTALVDNPSLTVRHISGRNPYRIVIDEKLTLPSNLNLFTDKYKTKTIIVTNFKNENSQKHQNLADNGIKFIFADNKPNSNFLNLQTVLKKLAENKIASILLEGGTGLASAMITEKLINKILLFQAPLLLGSSKHFCKFSNILKVDNGIKLHFTSQEKIGSDLLITAYPDFQTS